MKIRRVVNTTLFVLLWAFMLASLVSLFVKTDNDKMLKDYNDKLHEFRKRTTSRGYGLGD